MKKESITIRISKKLKDEFYKRCEENLQTPSIVVRSLIENYIKKTSKGEKENDRS